MILHRSTRRKWGGP